jgi:ribosomal protein L7/L12
MALVHITGWRTGFQKVSHTQALQELANMSLTEAKSNTDALLEGRPISINIGNISDAELLVAQLSELGAIAEVYSK